MVRYLVLLVSATSVAVAAAGQPAIELQNDPQAGTLAVHADGRELFAYQYGPQDPLPHIWPLRSPSGKLLTTQHPEPFPHHRSFWIADNVQVGDGPAVDFYHSWKNYNVKDDPRSGSRHFIRHHAFDELTSDDRTAVIAARLQWVVDESTPVLDETRKTRVHLLQDGEYFLDLSWELTPSRGDVRFVSDWVHYAWPYLRIEPQFAGDSGGTIADDQGRRGQAATNGQYARWIDYSNTIDGHAEGVAVLLYPDGKQHKWLTREYGAFGPRRADDLSGTNFSLAPGESLKGRVGVLVHRGDVTAGKVAQRYQQYIEDKL